MTNIEDRLLQYVDRLIKRYPQLKSCREDIMAAYSIMEDSYLNGGKLLIAGNGGSAADSEHIVGELMKSFKIPRPVTEEFAEKLKTVDGVWGEKLAKNLECGWFDCFCTATFWLWEKRRYFFWNIYIWQ